MITIAQNEYYSISYLPEKNRIYYKVTGYWDSTEVVPEYLTHIKEVLKHVKRGYTMLVEVADLVPHPDDVETLRKQAQRMAVEAGMLVAAEIVPNDILSDIQMDNMTGQTSFTVGKFGSYADAETWLDKMTQSTKKES